MQIRSGEKSTKKWKHSEKADPKTSLSEYIYFCSKLLKSYGAYSLMQVIYEDDVREFGDPSTTGHTVKSFTDPNFTCPQWLRELFAVAPQVKRLPKQKGKNRKRKRSVTDVDEAAGDNVRQNVDVQDAEGEGQPGAGEED
jgi:hypothetical protein